MGKKPAKGSGEVTKVEKIDYENYIRFGYRLPHGLVVTRVNAQIGGEDGIPLPVSFIDRAPVCMNGAINFDHLHDVLIFAVEEKVKKQAKLAEDQAEGPCVPLIGSDGEFIYPSDPGDENDTKGGHNQDCQCYNCEHPEGDKAEPYLSSQGQMIYPECDHLNGYCKGEDQCTEPGFPGKAE